MTAPHDVWRAAPLTRVRAACVRARAERGAEPSGGTVYELSGIVEHMGGMGGGHYVAHVHAEDGEWYSISDSSVTATTVDSVLEREAYILFYRRQRRGSE